MLDHINKVFLASSIDEFKEERKYISNWFEQLNNITKNKDFSIDFCISSPHVEFVSKEGTQNNYNKEIISSNLFILLVGKKLGTISKEEFDLALKNYQLLNKPYIAVMFQKTDSEDESVKKFKDFLNNDLKYYYKEYEDKFLIDNRDQIIYEIIRMLVKTFPSINSKFSFKIESKKLYLEDGDILSLENIPDYIKRPSIAAKFEKIKQIKEKIDNSDHFKLIDELTDQLKLLYAELEELNLSICNKLFSLDVPVINNDSINSILEEAQKLSEENKYYEASNLLSSKVLKKFCKDGLSKNDRNDIINALFQGIYYHNEIIGNDAENYVKENYELACDLELRFKSDNYNSCIKYFDYLYVRNDFSILNNLVDKILFTLNDIQNKKIKYKLIDRIGNYYLNCSDKINQGINLLLSSYYYYKENSEMNINNLLLVCYRLGKGYNIINDFSNANKYLNEGYGLVDDVVHEINNVDVIMKIYMQLGLCFDQINEDDKALYYINQGIEFYESSGYIDNKKLLPALSRLYYIRGFINYDKMNDYDEVKEDLEQKALPMTMELYKNDSKKYAPLLADIYFVLGGYYAYLQNPDKAHLYHKSSIALREEMHKKEPDVFESQLAKNYFYYAAFLASNKEYNLSSEYHQKAYLIYKNLLKSNFDAYVKDATFALNFHIGLYFVMLKDIENKGLNRIYETEEYNSKVKKLLLEANQICEKVYAVKPDLIRDFYANICICYSNYYALSKDYLTAIQWVNKGIDLRRQECSRNHNAEIHKLANDLYVIASCYYYLSNDEKNYFDLSIQHLIESKNILESLMVTQKESRAKELGTVNLLLSKIYLKQSNRDEAKKLALEAKELFEFMNQQNDKYMDDELNECKEILTNIESN